MQNRAKKKRNEKETTNTARDPETLKTITTKTSMVLLTRPLPPSEPGMKSKVAANSQPAVSYVRMSRLNRKAAQNLLQSMNQQEMQTLSALLLKFSCQYVDFFINIQNHFKRRNLDTDNKL